MERQARYDVAKQLAAVQPVRPIGGRPRVGRQAGPVGRGRDAVRSSALVRSAGTDGVQRGALGLADRNKGKVEQPDCERVSLGRLQLVIPKVRSD